MLLNRFCGGPSSCGLVSDAEGLMLGKWDVYRFLFPMMEISIYVCGACQMVVN
jgi:hypothetical protein